MNESRNKEISDKGRRATRASVVVASLGILIGLIGYFYVCYERAQIQNRKERMQSVLGWLLNDRVDGDVNGPQGSLLSWRSIALWKNAPMPPPPDGQQAWDISSNRILSEKDPLWFCDRGNSHTRLVAVRGEDTVFDRSIGEFIKVSRSESDAIVLVELHADTFVWTQPGDLIVDTTVIVHGRDDLSASALTNQATDYFVGFADGSIWLMSRETPLGVIVPFLTLSGATNSDRGELLAPYRIDE